MANWIITHRWGCLRSTQLWHFPHGGDQATKDFMDGVDTSWSRLPGGAPVQKLLDEAAARLQIDAPENIIPTLLKARPLIAAINHPDARRKLADLDEAIAAAAGLWLEVNATKPEATPGSQVELTLTAINRGHAQVELAGTQLEGIVGAPALAAIPLPFNAPQTAKANCPIPASQPLTQPLQLRHHHQAAGARHAQVHDGRRQVRLPSHQAQGQLSVAGLQHGQIETA